MNKPQYDELQLQLSKKTEKRYNKYGYTKYASAYKEGIMTAKSVLHSFYEHSNKGEWVYDENGVPYCSACGHVDALNRAEYEQEGEIVNNKSKFCPNCGLRMFVK